MKTLRKTKSADRRRQYNRRNFLRLERLEDRSVLSGASPVAANDLYHSLIDTPLDVSAPAGVLANDTDAEGDILSASLFSDPAHVQEPGADGSFVYTPNLGFTGTTAHLLPMTAPRAARPPPYAANRRARFRRGPGRQPRGRGRCPQHRFQRRGAG
jgi:hypothetical protein